MKKIFLALTGSIACIQSFQLIKSFQQKGYSVQCIVSAGGEKFSSPLALESISDFPVLGPDIFSFQKKQNPFEKTQKEVYAHLELSKNSDALVIAPCSAHTLQKIASGTADDFLSTAVLAYKKNILIAPAMNSHMLSNSSVQQNIQKIISENPLQYQIISPQSCGILACGEEGSGKMATVDTIVKKTLQKIYIQKNTTKYQKKVLINLGGTQEKIDPIRFIGNISTGKTGKIFAEKCFEMGADVSVVQGNCDIEINSDIFHTTKAPSSKQMKEEMEKYFFESDIVIFSAAVADFCPKTFSEKKIKKNTSSSITTLDLQKSIDIAQYFSQKKRSHQVFIGFALETGNEEFLRKTLLEKAHSKKFDIIMGNSPQNSGTVSGKYLVYFSKTQTFKHFSGKKSDIFEEILKSL